MAIDQKRFSVMMLALALATVTWLAAGLILPAAMRTPWLAILAPAVVVLGCTDTLLRAPTRTDRIVVAAVAACFACAGLLRPPSLLEADSWIGRNASAADLAAAVVLVVLLFVSIARSAQHRGAD